LSPTFDEYLDGILSTFDSLDLKTEFNRRVAVKPIYDFYQILIVEVSVHLCRFDRKSMQISHLKTRWDLLKVALSTIDDPKKWDQLINQIQNARTSVEHTDYEIPSTDSLQKARKQAPEFKKWLMTVGQEYFKASKGFSFIQEYSILSRWYTGVADSIIDKYGEKLPFLIDTTIENTQYQTLKSVKERLEARALEIRTIDDLKKDDLHDLIELTKITENLEAKEGAFLRLNLCPKCGGKIVETQTSIGGNEEDPMPHSIIYRIGCEKCDYTVNEESIDI